MSSRLVWRGPQVMSLMERAFDEGLEAAGIFVAAQVAINIVNADLVDVGTLRDSWTAVKLQRGLVRIGSPVEYGTYHEFGTRYMAARPFLRPALFEHKAEIRKAFADAVRRRLR